VAPEDVVPEVDSGAYIKGFYALFRRHVVTQVPTEVTCFTGRRHNRRADRVTPAGKLRFICVPASIYAKPADQVLAPAEQALCDFVWLSLRDGIEPRSLVTFRNLDLCVAVSFLPPSFHWRVKCTQVRQRPACRRLGSPEFAACSSHDVPLIIR